MNKASFDKKVKKQLWFLNKKEKQALDQRLSSISDDDSVNLNKPVTFAQKELQNVGQIVLSMFEDIREITKDDKKLIKK
ncbi:hypothetical protein ACQKH8_05995, partial [Staphylococcus aureus]